MGDLIFCKDDDAAGVTVQSMDGEDRAIFFPQHGFQGDVLAFAIGYAQQAGGLVYGNEAFVLE